MQLTSPLLLHNCIDRLNSYQLLCCIFLPHCLCWFQKNFVRPSGTTVGKPGWEDYQHLCDFVISIASKVSWISQPSKPVQVQSTSKPKSRIFFLQKWNRESQLKLRQLLNYLCSEDIACKEEKKDRRFSRNKIHRNIGNLLREFSAIKWDATVTAVIKGN